MAASRTFAKLHLDYVQGLAMMCSDVLGVEARFQEKKRLCLLGMHAGVELRSRYALLPCRGELSKAVNRDTLKQLLFLLMMTKIGLLCSTAFPSGMKSMTKKRQAFVLVFHAEETGGIGSGAEKKGTTV